jgi:hypothetical protein
VCVLPDIIPLTDIHTHALTDSQPTQTRPLCPHTAEGDAYDPTAMEAEFVRGDKDDVVLSVSQKGYQIGDKVVRRAGVTVSVTEATMAARAASGEGEGEGDGDAEEAAEEGEGEGEE